MPEGLGRLAAAALRRLGWAVLVVWVVATIVFVALRATGDPLEAVLGGPGSQAGDEAVAAARAQYGLDQPLFVQYVLQLWHVATLQLGDSYSRKQPVLDLIGAQVPNTLLLATLALVTAWLLALVGVTAVGRRGRAGRALDRAASAVATVATVTPQFWLGALLIVVLVTRAGWLPATSAGNSPAELALPVVTLAVPTAGYLFHVLHDALLEADAAPFAATSYARGASRSWVLTRHTLRHASLPALALTGWAYGSLLSGAVVVESLFARPGLGRLLLDAATQRDVPLVIGAVVVVALVYVIVIALTDLAEHLLDPRLTDNRAAAAPVELAVGA